MRNLSDFELEFVTGAGGCCSPCPPSSPSKGKREKNNNGYGNGPESGQAPGNSGNSNPTLVGQNTGNRPGPRGNFER